MKVTALKQLKKAITAVTLDDGSELLLDSELIIIENIKIGFEIEDVEKIQYLSDFKRAKSRALWYLSRSDHSERNLLEKLLKGGFSEKASYDAVERMKELGLINDEAYASRMAEYLLGSGISRREAEFKLVSKGISKDMAHELTYSDESECDKIKYLLEHKYRGKLTDEKSVKKVFDSLIRKGFSYSDVRAALREYSDEIIYSED